MAGIDLSGFVRVVQNEVDVIEGRYDGKDYRFLHGKACDVPNEAAAHIFGLGLGEQARITCVARLGWAETGKDIPAALARLKRIKFLDVPPVPELEETGSSSGPLGNSSRESGGGKKVPAPGEPSQDGRGAAAV